MKTTPASNQIDHDQALNRDLLSTIFGQRDIIDSFLANFKSLEVDEGIDMVDGETIVGVTS